MEVLLPIHPGSSGTIVRGGSSAYRFSPQYLKKDSKN